MVTSLKPLFPKWYEPDDDTIKLIITKEVPSLWTTRTRVNSNRSRHEPWSRQECHYGATTGPNRCGSTPHTTRTHTAVAAETQGAPHRVCRWGMVAAQ